MIILLFIYPVYVYKLIKIFAAPKRGGGAVMGLDFDLGQTMIQTK